MVAIPSAMVGVSWSPARFIDYDKPSNYLNFWYIPEQIEEEVSASWEAVQIIGRSSPIQSYAGTEPRTVTLSLMFHADGTGPSIKAEVHNKVMFLRSFVYPEYKVNYLRPPHRLQLIIGSFLNVVGIVETAPVTWRAPYELGTVFPMLAEVTLTLKETVPDPYDYLDVRGYEGGSILAPGG